MITADNISGVITPFNRISVLKLVRISISTLLDTAFGFLTGTSIFMKLFLDATIVLPIYFLL